MTFDDLGLDADIVRAVAEHGYTEPTPIQASAIPAVLAGRDLLAGAQTGTGKTAGFVLPLLQRLSQEQNERSGNGPFVLILTPTRELAAQVEESVRIYGKYKPLKSTVIFGGVGMQPQVDRLRRHLDILVATPGRLLDHLGQGTLSLKQIRYLVLDEADRMLDMGFIHDVRRVLKALPNKRQNLFYSATFSDEIKTLADSILHNPAEVEVTPRNTTTELVNQRVYFLPKAAKRHLLADLIKAGNWHQVLVFTRTKHGANRLSEQLSKSGIPALAIHGNKSQTARTRALADFKSGDIQVLVATDIAARGIDIRDLPHVVNFDLPNVSEDYVHRIGRTGRAKASGEAISLIGPEDAPLLKGIERLIGFKIERVELTAAQQEMVAAVDARAEEAALARPPREQQRRPRPASGTRSRAPNSGNSGNSGNSENGNRGSRNQSAANRASDSRPEGGAPKRQRRRRSSANGNASRPPQRA